MVVRVILFILLMKENLYVYASGYDAYSSCYRKSRKKQDLPCDFGKQSWCNIPGSSYPWHAVRRFVHENQGLMRRMYGDERHLSVLRAELESNDVEYLDSLTYKDEFRRRYSKDIGARGFVRIFMDNEKPNERKTKAEKLQKSIDEKSNSVLYHNHFGNPKEGDVKAASLTANRTYFKPLTTSTKTSHPEPTPRTESMTQQNDVLRMNITTTTASQQLTSTLMDATTQSDTYNYTTISKPDDAYMEDDADYSAETEDIMTTTGSETLTTTGEIEWEDEEGQEKDEGYQDGGEDEEEEEEEEEVVDDQPEVVEEPVSQPPPMIRLKGINACPVKEEVVAPFWANNTRGEVLALLNLYPFEQYVHWEKCTFEHKQMFCREGCRCEQQYRLHRLLAYDPNNECRGIFSDWFRFPSCCVCKCYDIPMEFRLTSRSPRFKDLGRNP